MELEVPPALGNGQANAGLPLARLLWHLPARAMVSLIEALLLERRILMVAQDKDTVSAAVHGAAALLYPFSWQHIYLPLLPLALKVISIDRQPSLCARGSSHLLKWMPALSQDPFGGIAGSCYPRRHSSNMQKCHCRRVRMQLGMQTICRCRVLSCSLSAGCCMQEV